MVSIGFRKKFAAYKIEGAFLEALKENNFKFDHKADGVTSLTIQGRGCWNFWREGEKRDGELKLVLNLGVAGRIEHKERGVVLRPNVAGSCASSDNFWAQLQVFKVVAEFDPSSSPIVKKIVEGDGQATIAWQDIQLGGIRSLSQLFGEFCGNNKGSAVESLVNSHLSPFNPSPIDKSLADHKFFYLPESDQPMLFKIWSKQLEDYKASL